MTVDTEKSRGRDDVRWLTVLEPMVGDLLDRHLAASREWFPHQYVPWGRASDFDGPLGGEEWREEQSALAAPVRGALVLNLLTEDNLPGYHHAFATTVSADGAWGTWLHRWTAEEDRHSAALRAYLHAARAVDPVALERARMRQVSTGFRFGDSGVLPGLAYVMVQELATRVAHRNAGRHSGDPVCEGLMARVAADENLHMVFYRDLFRAALSIEPGPALEALSRTLRAFRMPGHGAPDFERLAADVALGGIFHVGVFHDEVAAPLLRTLKALDMPAAGSRGRRCQDELGQWLEALGERARAFDERRAALLEARARDGAGLFRAG
ncbi:MULTISPECIES: acyl-ACP desaturase [Streptomyces]|uniref:acyl-ACP desaturase n=1 Tax=Streptomyces TaxID=1883 RepID=UPI001F624D25|nr:MULTISPECIES: acyl-ACP desaturase [Streptomyces]